MYRGQKGSQAQEAGAVAIFTAIFFLLLISVITIGFLRLMLQERSQAIDNDLSLSAYNSAQAGVEDAKRIVQWYSDNCPGGAACTQLANGISNSATNCRAVYDTINGNNQLRNGIGGLTVIGDGVRVSNDSSFNQAYTCLSIRTETPNVRGSLKEGQSDMIPLRTIGNASFTRVKVSWYSTKDTNGNPANPSASPATPLEDKPSWPVRRPPMMRAELVQHPNNNFKLDDVSSKTRFLYPNSLAATVEDSFSFDDGVIGTPFIVTPSSCSSTPRSSGFYYCEVNIGPAQAPPYNPGSTAYYLRLTSIYDDTDFQLELLDGALGTSGTPVSFAGVQPIVDVTGRANNVFRRMQVGLRSDSADYPDNALETAQQLCKNFRVTGDEADFDGASCAPAP